MHSRHIFALKSSFLDMGSFLEEGNIYILPEQRQQRIKVVRIIARLNIGGPAKQALFLTDRLNPKIFQSYLISGVVGIHEENLVASHSHQEENVHILPMLGREISWWQDFCVFLELCRILKSIQPDIVHTHTAKAGVLGRLAAIWARVPIKIHTFHGHIFKEYFGKVKSSLFIFIERVLAYFTDRLVVLSESQCRELTYDFKISSRRKFQIIPLGFNLVRFVSGMPIDEVRHRFGMASKAFVIGFVGRLVPIKNPFLLLDAYAYARNDRQKIQEVPQERLKPWYLLVAGGGELHEAMESNVLAKGLSEHVKFCGWQHEVEHVYAAANVVVLTSLNEGTPVTLIEAMASGKPFISTNVGGVVDLMEGEGESTVGSNGGTFTLFKNGILVDSQDAKGLAGALLYLVTHPEEAKEMGGIGREFVLKRFDENRLLGDLRELYQDLLTEKGIQFSCV